MSVPDKAMKLKDGKIIADQLSSMIAVQFVQATANAAGSYVVYNGEVFYLPDGHTAGTTWANTTKEGPTNIGEINTQLKTAIQGKQDAPSTAGTADQVMVLDDNLKPVWRTVPGVGAVTGDQISGNPIQDESENLLGAFTDNKYATNINKSTSAEGFSFATADIQGYEYVILTSYTNPSTVGYPFVFYNNLAVVSIGGITEYEIVDTKTYKFKIPDGATHVHVNINTSQKGTAICKGVNEGQKELQWLKIISENISQSLVDEIAENVGANLDIKPTVIDGIKKEYGGNAPDDISTENGYYTMKQEGVDPGFSNSLTHFEFSVKENDIIETYLGGDVDVISQSLKNNYFIVVDSNGKCTKAFDVTIDSNYIYRFRIPENGATCYITKYGTSAYVKLYEDTFVLNWLLLKRENFYPNTIPENSIIKDSSVSYIHGETIEKPFDFNNKKIMLFGDSIAARVANEGQGNIDAGENAWIRKFVSKVGATLSSKAIGGATIAYRDNESPYNSVYTQVTTQTEETDFIIIAGGTNDYNQSVNVGSYGDTTKYTTYGALYLICEYLKTQYPNATVIFITPINVTKDVSNIPKENLNKYRNAIYEVATSYGYNVVNGADLVPVSKGYGWDDEFIKYVDGTHPTLKGHAMYFKNLCMKLL